MNESVDENKLLGYSQGYDPNTRISVKIPENNSGGRT
jgi:hypothetical protein